MGVFKTICGGACVSRPCSSANKVQPNLFLRLIFVPIVACDQTLLFGRAKRNARGSGEAARAEGSPLACLSRVHFSRYPPNGELARMLPQSDHPRRLDIRSTSPGDQPQRLSFHQIDESIFNLRADVHSSAMTATNQV